jgi:hypothetical protein
MTRTPWSVSTVWRWRRRFGPASSPMARRASSPAPAALPASSSASWPRWLGHGSTTSGRGSRSVPTTPVAASSTTNRATSAADGARSAVPADSPPSPIGGEESPDERLSAHSPSPPSLITGTSSVSPTLAQRGHARRDPRAREPDATRHPPCTSSVARVAQCNRSETSDPG